MVSLIGIASLTIIALLVSTNRKAINIRTVGTAFILQAGIGALVFYFPWGKLVLTNMAELVSSVLSYSQAGIGFLLGNLADQSWNGLGFVLAINVLPVIVFFAALIAVLYHIRVMEVIIRIIGGALQMALRCSRPESLSAAANIFVGQTEAPLVCLLYTSPSPRDVEESRMPSSA